jgi:two-component system response regulator TctD
MESVDAIEVLVHRLRKRLSSASVDLVTLRGLGYMLMDQLSMGQECGV